MWTAVTRSWGCKPQAMQPEAKSRSGVPAAYRGWLSGGDAASTLQAAGPSAGPHASSLGVALSRLTRVMADPQSLVWAGGTGVPPVSSVEKRAGRPFPLNCRPSYSPTTPAARGFRDSRVTQVTADPAACGSGRGHGRPARHDPSSSAGCRCYTPIIRVTGVPPAWFFGKRAGRPFPLGFADPGYSQTTPAARGFRD
jgi:hypothetical protein